MDEERFINTLKFYEEIHKSIMEEYKKLLAFAEKFRVLMHKEKLLLPYHMNIIDELHINENGHSRILLKLLQFRNTEGDYDFLESLLRYIKGKTRFSKFSRIQIKSPLITQEEARIDLWVRDREGGYAIIFENKVYNAHDQEAQLSRYIDKTKAEPFNINNIFVVYLSSEGQEPDGQSWGGYKEEFKDRYINLSFRDDILTWLKEEVLPNINDKDVYLDSAVKQYIDYLEGLFGIRTINNRLNMNIEKLFEEQFELSNCSSDKNRMDVLNDKISDFESITNQMRNLKNKYRQNIIDSWQDDIRNRYPMLQESTIKDKYVGVDINYYGKLIHVFIYADSQLYCQVEYDNNLPDEERLIAETPVLNLSDILTNKPNKTHRRFT